MRITSDKILETLKNCSYHVKLDSVTIVGRSWECPDP